MWKEMKNVKKTECLQFIHYTNTLKKKMKIQKKKDNTLKLISS